MTIKRITQLLVMIVFTMSIHAQSSKIDSLENLLANHAQVDRERVDLLNSLAYALGNSYMEKGRAYAMSADSLSDILHYPKGKANSLNKLGIYYYRKADYPKALAYYQEALQIAEELEYKDLIISSLNNSGVIYMFQGHYAKALECYDKKLAIALELQDTVELCITYNNYGIVFNYKGDYTMALEYYHKTLALSTKINDKSQLGSAYSNIGILYKKQKEYAKALEYYAKASGFHQEIGDKHGLCGDYLNMGSSYSSLMNYPKALEYYQKSLELSKAIGYNLAITICYGNIGNAYAKLGDNEKALSYYKQELEMAQNIGSKTYITTSYINLSEAYYALKKLELARTYGEKAYRIAQDIKHKDKCKEASEILHKVYASMQQYEKAYAYHIIFKTQSDSLFNENNTREIARLESQYEFDKEKEVMAADQDRKDILHAAKLQHQKELRNWFIIGFGLMLILTLLIIRSLRQNRKANRLLTKQKTQIEQQAGELKSAHDKLLSLNRFKEGLSSMIVHDLKNPLNAIINSATSHNLEHQVREMKQMGSQMLTMVLNILDVNKYEESRISLDKKQHALFDLSQSAITSTLFLAERKNISIENNINSTIGVEVDRDIIERVFVNLLTNAIKYTPNNGFAYMDAEIVHGELVKVIVKDTGEGIPADKIPLVFEKFGQLKAKQSGRIRSTGLGLTFCKMAVEAHGGTIEVRSEPQQGATFEFTLALGTLQSSTSSVSIHQHEEYRLSPDEKQRLKPLVDQLKEIEIYKLFEIRKRLRALEDDGSASIKQWKMDVLNAVSCANKTRYHELLSL